MKLVKLLAMVIALLVVTSVTLSNHSLDDSQRVSDLTAEITSIEKANTLLATKIASVGSLTAVSSRVEALGFTEQAKVVSISLPGTVASR